MAVTVQNTVATVFAQKDGRQAVVETITLSNGRVEIFAVLLNANDNVSAHATAAGSALLASLAAWEIGSNIADVQTNGINASPSFIYSTIAANSAEIRSAYRIATDRQAAFIGEYLNSLSNAVLSAAFGITTGQAATLKTNVLAPQAALAASIRAAAGQ